jgi:hypothetical protein
VNGFEISSSVVEHAHPPHSKQRTRETHPTGSKQSEIESKTVGQDRTGALVRTGDDDMNTDFKRGLYTGMGVLAAVYLFGLATGVLKKVF